MAPDRYFNALEFARGRSEDPNYKPSIGGLWGLDHIVSFGQDNAGNMYIVDFGNPSNGQSTFDGEYPAAGLGEIFKLVPLVKGDFNLDGKLTTADISAMLAALTNLNQYQTNSQLTARNLSWWPMSTVPAWSTMPTFKCF